MKMTKVEKEWAQLAN